MTIKESAEMYLETILVLSKKGSVRSIDIAKAMGFSRPSVSVTIHNLESEDYIKVDENGLIELRPKGAEIANTIYERHTVLSELFEKIGVNPTTAVEDACRIEHYISPETFDKVKELVEKLEEHNLY